MSWLLWLFRRGFGGSVAVLDDLEQMSLLSWIVCDGDYLEVAVAGDLCGWAFVPYRSPHGSPATQLFSHKYFFQILFVYNYFVPTLYSQ